ncbi:hypothetical protein ACIPEL_03175 [Streptomyces griseoviridis]
MAKLLDEYGADVEIYVKALTTTTHIGTPPSPTACWNSSASNATNNPTGERFYVWHTVPDHLGFEEQKRVASRAVPALLLAEYTVN